MDRPAIGRSGALTGVGNGRMWRRPGIEITSI